MNKFRFFVFLITACLFIIPIDSFAQEERCLSFIPMDLKEENTAIITDWLSNHRNAIEEREVIDINVVFHVIYNTVDENISDEQILSQLEVINQDFRLQNENQSIVTWSSFQDDMADMKVNFQLAQVDPDGQPTTGINRRVTTIPKIALKQSEGRRRICYTSLGGLDAWCTDHYLNIWIGKFDTGFFAEASFPGQDLETEDGIRIDPFRVGLEGTTVPPYHLGRTLTHEIGHYFNLSHLWGTGIDDLACQEDDGIDDTPQQAFNFLGECPNNFNLQSCGSIDQFPNYLNYTDDACMAMFTQQQKETTWAVLNTLRLGLKQPSFCGVIPTADLNADPKVEIAIFPNPSYGSIKISVSSKDQLNVSMDILKSNGQLLSTSQFSTNEEIRLKTMNFAPGIYFLKFNISNFLIFRKLIILS